MMKMVGYQGFDADMDDEIDICVNDILHISEVFDDGWAYGLNSSSGEKGIFPLVVCKSIAYRFSGTDKKELYISPRNSSFGVKSTR